MNLIDKILLKENINHLAFLFEEVKQDITETEEFKAWFGDSKVVDGNGKPLVVYHGTGSEFEKFDKTKIGKNFRQSEGVGFFFSASMRKANRYADSFRDINRLVDVYLKIENPLIKTTTNESPADYFDHNTEMTNETWETSERDGVYVMTDERKHDGIIIRGGGDDDLYIVFEPNQIKSVNNKGTFDSVSDNITEEVESNSLESEARKYDSFEEFKAYGFDVILKDLKGIERDTIVIIPTEKVEIKWKEDYDNALETAKKEYNPKTAEPVDLIYDFKKDKYILDDGHNRYVSAQRNNQPIRGVINHIEGNLEELEELYNKERDITLTDIWNNSR